MTSFQSIIITCLLIKVLVCDDLPCAVRQTEYGAVCVCNSTYCDTVERPPPLSRGRYYRYTTDSVNPGFHRTTGQFKTMVFTINPSIKHQEIVGFGGSFSDATGIVLDSLPPETQDRFIESYFSTNGIEYSMGRTPIGCSDFSQRFYTYDDSPCDESLEHFSLAEEDYKYKIPLIQKAIKASPHDFKMVGSSFTSPNWMKLNHNWSVGYLKDKYFNIWAKYHIKFLDAYADKGIKMWTLTAGNEIALCLYAPYLIMGTGAYPHDHVRWYRDYLAPSLAASNHSHVKLLILDDVRIFANAWMSRFSLDPEVYKLVEGIALHWYADWFIPEDLLWPLADTLHYYHPDKLNVFTESSVNLIFGGKPVELGSWTRGTYYIYSIIQNLNHWTNGYIDWNLALDTNGGPTLSKPIDAAVIVNSSSGEFYKNPIFYAFGHFSKFIPPGSFRLDVQNTKKSADYSNYSNYGLFKPDGNPILSKTKNPALMFPPNPNNRGKLQTFNLPKNVFCTATVNSDSSSTIIVFNSMDFDVNVIIEDTVSGYITATLTANSINTFVYWLNNK